MVIAIVGPGEHVGHRPAVVRPQIDVSFVGEIPRIATRIPYGAAERETATVMLALGVGLGLLRSIDPAISVNGLIDTLRLVTGQPF